MMSRVALLLVCVTALGDLRPRLGLLDKLSAPQPIVVMDSEKYNGPKRENSRTTVAKYFVLLHFDDEEQHHAVVITADG